MAEQVNRRNFLKTSVAAAAGAGYLASPGSAANPQSEIRNPKSEAPGANGMPTGRIKNLKISRLISGGNLISGRSHARDLIYVHDLMDNHNMEKKVLETLAVLEENGVNTILADPRKKPMDIFKKYWSQGGKIQWIAFKTLTAGAIPPASGFKYAFEGGADFLCVGMFDFQVREDAIIAKKTLGELKNRERAWFA